MEQFTCTIPRLYADHHVSKIRQVLLAMTGIEDVIASAAFNELTVHFETDKVSPERIVDELTKAGYAPGEVQIVARTPNATSDPAWEHLAPRHVTTNPVDLQMSGEFRKY